MLHKQKSLKLGRILSKLYRTKISSLYQVVLIILVCLLLSSCSSIKYNYGLIYNHLSIIKNAQPIDEILEENTTDPELKIKLRLVNKIKDFAIMGPAKQDEYEKDDVNFDKEQVFQVDYLKGFAIFLNLEQFKLEL